MKVRFGSKLLALSVFLALGARGLSAQSRVITLVAGAPSSLTVTLQSGAVQTIVGITDNAINNFPTPVVIHTDWDVKPGQTSTVNLVAYFSIPAQAMTGGAVQIPSSRIQGRMTTGLPVAFTPMTQNGIGGVGSGGGSLALFSVPISGPNKNASRTDNLDLRLDLVGFPTLPAGAYTGVLNIRAVTQ
jgi:hypothetical protein